MKTFAESMARQSGKAERERQFLAALEAAGCRVEHQEPTGVTYVYGDRDLIERIWEVYHPKQYYKPELPAYRQH